jgi:Domain of unknown function (DUF1772)
VAVFDLSSILILFAILCLGVTYGAQTFFAVIARPALQRSDDAALGQVMGRIHEVAMLRMALFGFPGAFATFALIFLTGLGSLRSWLAIVAFLMLCADLGLSAVYGWPVNRKLIAAVQRGETRPDTRALQRHWDRGNLARALVAGVAVACLTLMALAH